MVVHLKFLDQNGRQFRLDYVTAPIDTVVVTCTYDTGRGVRQVCGNCPRPLYRLHVLQKITAAKPR